MGKSEGSGSNTYLDTVLFNCSTLNILSSLWNNLKLSQRQWNPGAVLK